MEKTTRTNFTNKEVLTFSEAAAYMGIKPGSLYNLTSKKLIPHSKPNGKMIYFRKDVLVEWLTRNEIRPDDK